MWKYDPSTYTHGVLCDNKIYHTDTNTDTNISTDTNTNTVTNMDANTDTNTHTMQTPTTCGSLPSGYAPTCCAFCGYYRVGFAL